MKVLKKEVKKITLTRTPEQKIVLTSCDIKDSHSRQSIITIAYEIVQ